MRVLHIADYFQPFGGNFIASLSELERTLALCNGHMIYVLPSAAMKQPWYEAFAQGKEIYLVDSKPTESQDELLRILLATNPDIVHSHFDSFDVALVKACKAYKQQKGIVIKQVWHLHNQKGYSQHGIKKLYWKLRFAMHYGYYSKDVSVISVSDEMNRFITKYHKLIWHSPIAKIRTLPNGIEVSRCGERTDFSKHEPFTFLAFGRSNVQKRIDLLTSAAEILITKGRHLKIMITKGDAYDAICQLYGGNQPQWIEWIAPSDDIVSIFQKVDCFVSSSLHETFSYAVCEASIYGLPVIQSDIEGTLWNAENPSTLLFHTLDVNDLARQMDAIMSKSESEIAKNCIITRDRNKSEYTIQKWCQNVIEFYRHL